MASQWSRSRTSRSPNWATVEVQLHGCVCVCACVCVFVFVFVFVACVEVLDMAPWRRQRRWRRQWRRRPRHWRRSRLVACLLQRLWFVKVDCSCGGGIRRALQDRSLHERLHHHGAGKAVAVHKMVRLWFVKVDCSCGGGIRRHPCAAQQLTQAELDDASERYGHHQWFCCHPFLN